MKTLVLRNLRKLYLSGKDSVFQNFKPKYNLKVVLLENNFYLCKKTECMKFDKITENGNLWAVRYEDCIDNVLDNIFD